MSAAEEGRPRSVIAANAPRILLGLIPAAMTAYLGFRAGGFFIGATGGVALFLLLLLAGRVLIVPLPAEGLNLTVAIAVVALILFAVWTLLSGGWSHAPGRALAEFDRVLLYASALLVFGLVRMSPRRLRVMVRGLALATVIVCGAGLITRLAPDLWGSFKRSASPRLSYPITYWNAFALLAAIGITICFGLTSTEKESRVVRILAAAAIPVLGSALLLTVSRGGVATAALGILVFAIVGHPRGLLSGALASLPATALAMSTTYNAELLAPKDPMVLLTSAAQAEGHHVAAVVALCAVAAGFLRWLFLYLDDVLVQLRPTKAVRRQILSSGVVALLAVGVIAGAVVDAPGQVDKFFSHGETEQSDNTSSSTSGSKPKDLRSRLTNVTDNGRLAFWSVSMDGFKASPLRGTGAGTFEHEWDEKRDIDENVLDAHGLYPEVLGELGLVGLGLLVISLMAIMIGIGRRVRGHHRALFATIFAAAFAWVVAAGFDWHWEMPVVTAWFFALGGAAIAAPPRRTPATRFLGTLPRAVIAFAVVVLIAIAPARLIISQDRLESTLIAFGLGACDQVATFSKESLDAVGSRPEPYEFRAACELSEDDQRGAILAMKEAIARDTDSWRLHYSLASAQALAGRDARLELRRAARLNPRNELLQRTAGLFASADRPSEWRRLGRELNLRIILPTV